jgi:hypothetical protein
MISRKAFHATIIQEIKGSDITWTVKDQTNRKPQVDLRISGSTLLLHQSNHKSEDVLEVTVGQAYDLITALSRALDIPMKGF